MPNLVSCLMPTYNRRRHIGRAIRCFLEQTYAHRELLILDDGTDVMNGMVPAHPLIRYYRNENRLPHGQKLAHLAEVARGDLFAFWDDDDWHGPERLTRQAAAIASGADVVLLERFVGYDEPCDHAYVWDWRNLGAFADGTAMFTRRFYRNGPPFSAEERHPAQTVLRSQPRAKVAWLDGTELYMQILHSTNSATTHMQGPGWIPATPEITRLAREHAQERRSSRSGWDQ